MAQKIARLTGPVRRLRRARQPADRSGPLPQGAAARQAAGRSAASTAGSPRPTSTPRASSEEFDPSNTALQGAYTALFSDYVKNELKWETDLHYDTSGNVRPWTYDQNRYMDMTEPLRQTMAKNPFLKVFVAAGYYDMATPCSDRRSTSGISATIRRSRSASRSAITRRAT